MNVLIYFNKRSRKYDTYDMKKQYICMLAGCVALLGSAVLVHAQAPTSVPGTATTTAAAKKARLQGAVAAMERNFEVRIAGLESLAGRIQTSIAKIQIGGKDMTAASAKLVAAQKLIAEAKAELANLKKADTTMVAAAKPATAFGNVKNRFAKNVTAKIKAAHAALVETIVIMKGQGASGSATSSTSTVQ